MMRSPVKFLIAAIGALTLSVALGGCMMTKPHLSQEFGASEREGLVAQIADPEPHYAGTPDPGADGARVALAQDRYVTGKVIPPVNGTVSTLGAKSFNNAGSNPN